MVRFVVGFAVVWSALFAWAMLDQRDWFWTYAVGEQWGIIAAKLLGLPIAVAWFVTDLVQFRGPRRVFDARVRRPIAPIAAGLFTGLLAVVMSAGKFALLQSGLVAFAARVDPDHLDLAVVGVSAGLATLLVVSFMRPARPGTCIFCEYDLTGAPSGRCPECGAVGSSVERAGHRARRGICCSPAR